MFPGEVRKKKKGNSYENRSREPRPTTKKVICQCQGHVSDTRVSISNCPPGAIFFHGYLWLTPKNYYSIFYFFFFTLSIVSLLFLTPFTSRIFKGEKPFRIGVVLAVNVLVSLALLYNSFFPFIFSINMERRLE